MTYIWCELNLIIGVKSPSLAAQVYWAFWFNESLGPRVVMSLCCSPLVTSFRFLLFVSTPYHLDATLIYALCVLLLSLILPVTMVLEHASLPQR